MRADIRSTPEDEQTPTLNRRLSDLRHIASRLKLSRMSPLQVCEAIIEKRIVDDALIAEITTSGPDFDAIDERVAHFRTDARVLMESDSHRTALRYGNMIFSEVIWT
jgi:hypothetical protein